MAKASAAPWWGNQGMPSPYPLAGQPYKMAAVAPPPLPAMPPPLPPMLQGAPPPLPFRVVVQRFESMALSQLAGIFGRGKAAGGGMPAAAGAADISAPGAMSTIGALTGAISSVVSTATKYAEAAAPSAVLVLNQAMYDFTAVIGQAMTPVVLAAAEGIKMLGGVLMPVMQALTPVISKLTGVFLSLLSQAMPALETMGELFVSVASFLGDLFDALSPLVTVTIAFYTAFYEVVKAIGEWIGSLFGSGGMGTLKSGIQELAKLMLMAAGAIAVFVGRLFGVVGGGAFMEGLLKATDPNKKKPTDITGFGVAKDAQMLGFSEYGRKVSTAALIAGSGAAPERQTNEWLADVYNQLMAIKSGAKSDLDTLREEIAAKLDEVIDAILNGVKKKAYDAADTAASTTETLNPFTLLRRLAGLAGGGG